MSKKLKLLLIILIPIICLIIAGIPFTLADYPETQTEQTMNGTSAENTGASTADKSMKGGALYISNGASYTMTGGSIAGKTNQYGGAVYVTNGSTFTMTGGTITGCTALYGGAIYVEAGGTCNITGGTITENKAQYAPAIYVEDGGILNVDQTAVIKDNEYEKYGNPLEIYVDGELVETRFLKVDTYTIDENEMPLDYEHCCGYFLDEKLSQCSFGEIALTSEAKGFAPRTADAENYVARLYTRTANPDNFSFYYDKTTGFYDIKAKNTSISGHIVLPKEYDNKQTSIYNAISYSAGAFYNCKSMIGITFQEGLLNVGNYAFYILTGLTGELIIPNSVASIGYQSFYYCSGLIGDLILPQSVITVGNQSFTGCSGITGNLKIGNNVTTIGYSAFFGCSGFAGELTIPDSVTSIGESAFEGCVGFNGGLTVLGRTSIGESAFEGCSGFNGGLTIGNAVTSIGRCAFLECSGFTGNLTIGDSVTSIGGLAFAGCSGFTGNLVIPAGVTSIGDRAFNTCNDFSSVVINEGNTVYEDKGKNVIVEKSTNTLLKGFNCTNLSVVEEVESVENYAFYNCSGLNGNLKIGNNVTKIGSSAFFGCSGLTGCLIIGNNVTSIGDYVFRDCYGLTSVYIPSSVTTIAASHSSSAPFHNCSSSLVIYTDVANAESIPSGWGTYWNHYYSSYQLEVVYGCSLDADGNIVLPTNDINIYVDGVQTKNLSFNMNTTSYTMNEADMPLDYESCCGYFLDSEFTKTIKNNTIDLSNGDVNLYTKQAVITSGFTFTLDESTNTYSVALPVDRDVTSSGGA